MSDEGTFVVGRARGCQEFGLHPASELHLVAAGKGACAQVGRYCIEGSLLAHTRFNVKSRVGFKESVVEYRGQSFALV